MLPDDTETDNLDEIAETTKLMLPSSLQVFDTEKYKGLSITHKILLDVPSIYCAFEMEEKFVPFLDECNKNLAVLAVLKRYTFIMCIIVGVCSLQN